MHLCIFNPEHDLCLAKGRAHYVPPRSAVDFARRDAGLMQVLYPDAHCCSVYDLTHSSVRPGKAASTPNFAPLRSQAMSPLEPGRGEQLDSVLRGSSSPHKLGGVPHRGEGVCQVIAWGWDAVVKHELIKRGVSAELLPSDEEIDTIRELQHRSTVLPLQEDCHEVRSIEDMESLLKKREHWVMKAPWSGAGRGLRWVHGILTAIDRDWLVKTVATQRCVIAEPRRDVVADVALEYVVHTPSPLWGTPPNLGGELLPLLVCSSPKLGEGNRPGGVEEECVKFIGYSYFKTGSGVYKENILWPDEKIESTFSLLPVRERVEQWLKENVWSRYRGPLGVDLMVCADGSFHVSEINFRHTMGMVAHEKLRVKR